MKKDPKLNIALKRSSWRNVMDSIRAGGTKIASVGNFWAAIQEVERQLAWHDQKRAIEAPRAKDRIGEDRFELVCASCDQPLTLPGGYDNTGLCGPCATGEAATIEEIGEIW
jgi:hypothetical protein